MDVPVRAGRAMPAPSVGNVAHPAGKRCRYHNCAEEYKQLKHFFSTLGISVVSGELRGERFGSLLVHRRLAGRAWFRAKRPHLFTVEFHPNGAL